MQIPPRGMYFSIPFFSSLIISRLLRWLHFDGYCVEYSKLGIIFEFMKKNYLLLLFLIVELRIIIV